MVRGELMIDKCGSLMFAVMAGAAIVSNHEHNLLITVMAMSISLLFVNDLVDGKVEK